MAENATGDDMPVTPDSKTGDVDEDQAEHRDSDEKRKTVPRNRTFPCNRRSTNEYGRCFSSGYLNITNAPTSREAAMSQ